MSDTVVVDTTTNTVEITSVPPATIIIDESVSQVLEVGAPGPQGPPGPGGALGYYGTFYDTQDQPFAAVGTAQLVKINTQGTSSGMTLQSPGRIVIENPGTYTLIFSLQLKNSANETHYADIWLRYMGSDYPDSTTRFTVPARKNTNELGYAVATVNFVGTSINPNDYIELWWSSNDTAVSIEAIPAGTSPVTPFTPSVICTLTQVMYTQVGPQGPQGEVGPQGATGPQGPQGIQGPSGASTIGGYDVTVSGATNGDVLSFNGAAWYNRGQVTLTDGGNF